MTLDEFYKSSRSGTRVYKRTDDGSDDVELKIDQHTKCFLYDVVEFYAVEEDLIIVVVE